MTSPTVLGGRLNNPHAVVAAQALLVISGHQARPFGGLGGHAASVAAATAWRLLARRALVMAALAERECIGVEGAGKRIALDAVHEFVNDLAMGQAGGFKLLAENADGHDLWDPFRVAKRRHRWPGVYPLTGQSGGFLLGGDRIILGSQWHTMAVQAGLFVWFGERHQRRMAAGALGLGLLLLMAADTAGLGIGLVHGLGQLDTATLLLSFDGMATNAIIQCSVVADLAALVVLLVGLVIEGHHLHSLAR